MFQTTQLRIGCVMSYRTKAEQVADAEQVALTNESFRQQGESSALRSQ